MITSSKKNLAQYERLAGTLRDRIAAGVYAREDKLPSEMELMDESGLSRSTVRHALKVLVDEAWCAPSADVAPLWPTRQRSTRTTWCFRATRHRYRARA